MLRVLRRHAWPLRLDLGQPVKALCCRDAGRHGRFVDTHAQAAILFTPGGIAGKGAGLAAGVFLRPDHIHPRTERLFPEFDQQVCGNVDRLRFTPLPRFCQVAVDGVEVLMVEIGRVARVVVGIVRRFVIVLEQGLHLGQLRQAAGLGSALAWLRSLLNRLWCLLHRLRRLLYRLRRLLYRLRRLLDRLLCLLHRLGRLLHRLGSLLHGLRRRLRSLLGLELLDLLFQCSHFLQLRQLGLQGRDFSARVILCAICARCGRRRSVDCGLRLLRGLNRLRRLNRWSRLWLQRLRRLGELYGLRGGQRRRRLGKLHRLHWR